MPRTKLKQRASIVGGKGFFESYDEKPKAYYRFAARGSKAATERLMPVWYPDLAEIIDVWEALNQEEKTFLQEQAGLSQLPGRRVEWTGFPCVKRPDLAMKIGDGLAGEVKRLQRKLADKGLVMVLGKQGDANLEAPGTELASAVRHYLQKTKAKPAKAKRWDPFAAGRRAIEALKTAEGGAITPAEAALRLDIGRAQLYNRMKATRLVTWVDAAGRYRCPVWQFGINGLLPGVEECLSILAKLGTDEWAVMRFFLTESESAGGVSPLNLLRKGDVESAKQLATHAAAVC